MVKSTSSVMITETCRWAQREDREMERCSLEEAELISSLAPKQILVPEMQYHSLLTKEILADNTSYAMWQVHMLLLAWTASHIHSCAACSIVILDRDKYTRIDRHMLMYVQTSIYISKKLIKHLKPQDVGTVFVYQHFFSCGGTSGRSFAELWQNTQMHILSCLIALLNGSPDA